MDIPSRRYGAFISYSHAADGRLAPALQTGLERFAKPWYRRRALRVFRDKTGLAVTPELWGSIRRSLEASRFFILLASPAAAQSTWVQQEVEFWLQHRSVETLLIVLTDGNMAWDSIEGDFDWRRTDALPGLLRRRFSAEPNYWDAESGTKLVALQDHEQEVVHVEFSKDGRWLATASRDDTVRIRAAHDGKTTTVLRVPGRSFLDAAVFSPDSRRVLTLSHDDPPRLWDWQGAPGSSTASLSGPTEPLYFAGFGPDSTILVTIAGSGAQVWQVSTGRILHELKHEDAVSDAGFSPQGRWIVTAAVDGSATVWEASSGQRLMNLGAHDRARTTAAFAPDGSRIGTGTASGQVLVYACEACGSVAELLTVARSRVTRSLTPEERAKYRAPAEPR